MPHARNPDELGALWVKEGRKGKYMTGTINGVAVVVFKNERKNSERQPDFRVLKARSREERQAVEDDSEPF